MLTFIDIYLLLQYEELWYALLVTGLLSVPFSLQENKAWFKRRILHVPNQILILVDSNEYVGLIWFKRRIVLANKIAEREWRVLNSHSSKHKLFNIISIQFGTCKMRRLRYQYSPNDNIA